MLILWFLGKDFCAGRSFCWDDFAIWGLPYLGSTVAGQNVWGGGQLGRAKSRGVPGENP